MKKVDYFCCICMQKAELLVTVKNVDDNEVEYVEKLKFCVPKEIWKDTYKICNSCVSQLDVAYNFVQSCIESEQFRKEELKDDQYLTRLDEEITGKIKAQNDTKDTKFTCDQCNKSFRQKKYLSQHITKLHINKKRKEGIRRNVKRGLEECKVNFDLLKAENNSTELNVEIDIKDDPIKEEQNKENTDLDNDFTADKRQKTNLNTSLNDGNKKEVEFNPADPEDLGDTTDAGNEDIENYESSTAESEVDNDYEKTGKTSSRNRGPKKEPQKCNFCDEVFMKRHEWATHIRTKHTFQKPFSCDLCDAKYMNGYSLLIHKRKHTNEKPFICATCGKSFVSSADLNHHNKIHDTDRAYPCPMCDRSFKTHSNLRTHRLQMHLNPAEWKFACHICGKKFPIRGNLVKHLKRHAGIKEFICHVCSKSFVNKAELTLHLNTHTNQRLFKCKICAKDYKNREGLRRHMKVVHDLGNWKAPKSEKKHLCPMCPKIFAFGNKLQRHIFTHTGEKPFKCDYCQKRFIDNYGRKVHYKKDHNIVESEFKVFSSL